MKEIEIEQRHGYLLDGDGNVIDKFGNWRVGEHRVPDAVESIEYVDGPADHEREIHGDYRSDNS